MAYSVWKVEGRAGKLDGVNLVRFAGGSGGTSSSDSEEDG